MQKSSTKLIVPFSGQRNDVHLLANWLQWRDYRYQLKRDVKDILPLPPTTGAVCMHRFFNNSLTRFAHPCRPRFFVNLCVCLLPTWLSMSHIYLSPYLFKIVWILLTKFQGLSSVYCSHFRSAETTRVSGVCCQRLCTTCPPGMLGIVSIPKYKFLRPFLAAPLHMRKLINGWIL